MTLADRAVKHLRETRGQWVLAGDGTLIRRKVRGIPYPEDAACPLESLLGWEPGEAQYRVVGERARVMNAADAVYHSSPDLRRIERALRRRMLRAAGLTR